MKEKIKIALWQKKGALFRILEIRIQSLLVVDFRLGILSQLIARSSFSGEGCLRRVNNESRTQTIQHARFHIYLGRYMTICHKRSSNLWSEHCINTVPETSRDNASDVCFLIFFHLTSHFMTGDILCLKPFILFFITAVPGTIQADVRPAGIFGAHAVLQQDMPVPVWGEADPGEKVAVSFNGQEKAAQADGQGHWLVKLDAMTAGQTGKLIISGHNSLAFDDVIVGEVWLCSGQSNMAFPMRKEATAEQAIPNANNSKIRLFSVGRGENGAAKSDQFGRWEVCNPESVSKFSAVAYFFGYDLNKELHCPVGLIDAWTSIKALQALPDFFEIQKSYQKMASNYEVQNAKWNERQTTGGVAGMRKPVKPAAPGSLFDRMIFPLIPYAMRGAIWYQGEANSHQRQERYDVYLAALITDWRTRWGNDFPFGWVQLPDFRKPQQAPVEDANTWPLVRDAMLRALKIPHTGMAIALGLGEESTIHPPKKQEVGKRLALWALSDVYGKMQMTSSGPLPIKSEVRGREIVISFSHADGGLKAENDELKGFAITGADRKWVWADARVDGDEVVVSSAQVEKPVAVRYAWADNPVFSLMNGAGLPATPFRTDDFAVKETTDFASDE